MKKISICISTTNLVDKSIDILYNLLTTIKNQTSYNYDIIMSDYSINDTIKNLLQD